MNLPLLAFRNVRRNKTRTFLTVVGVTIAIFAFGFLRTTIAAYYSGAEAASADRLVVRSATSLVVMLPMGYEDQIRRIPGVQDVAGANWFGGVYKDPKNFFANFAVESEKYLAMYPEFELPPAQKEAYLRDPMGAVVGRKLADRFGWKVGDRVTLQGTIFTGNWDFNISAIYTGRDKATDETQFFFHWKYLQDHAEFDMRNYAGWYVVRIDPAHSAALAKTIDTTFKNTQFETLTESERSFQMSFLSMVSVIIGALQVISAFVLVIVALILGNTIAMAVRERGAEVAILKALGFSGGRLAFLIISESLVLALIGGLVGIAVSIPLLKFFGAFIEANVGNLFPVFALNPETISLMLGLAVLVGVLAALIPAVRTARVGVVNALRRVG